MASILAALLPAALLSALQCDVSHLPPPPFQTLRQPLDHSDPSGAAFDQRLQVIDSHYTPGGPLLFYAGPENAANLYSLLCLNLPSWAKSLGAAIVGVEHRYFGESKPPKGTGWAPLTLNNTLADYACVVQNMTAPGGRFEGARVFSFGGSYGGFLSAMMRITYPGLIFGAIASAAPILLYNGSSYDSALWYDTVASIYQTQDPVCATSVSEAFGRIASMLSAANYSGVAANLQTCAPPSEQTSTTLLIYLQHAMQMIAQFNYPSPAANKVGYPFAAVCRAFGSSDAFSAMRVAIDIAYNKTGKMDCTWTPPAAAAEAATLHAAHPTLLHDINFEESWFYITCSYFVLPITGGDAFFHFPHDYHFEGISDYCFSKFGTRPTSDPPISLAMVQSASNILFSNAAFDPTKGVSLQRSLSKSVTLLSIEAAAHTQDIVAPDTGDNVSLAKARDAELATLREWLGAQS